MRENEKQAIAQVVEILQGLLGGELPTAQPRAAPSLARARAPISVKEGDVHLEWDEENNGYGCLVCGEGVFKVGEAAEHAFTAHGIPLASLNATELTHGRKWMMKKYLEKHNPDALEGYGRAAKAPAKAKPVAKPTEAAKPPIKKWAPFKKKEPEVEEAEEAAVEETEIGHVPSSLRESRSSEETENCDVSGHLAVYKNNGMTHYGEILSRSGNTLMVKDFLTGETKVISTRADELSYITPYKASEYNFRLTNRSP